MPEDSYPVILSDLQALYLALPELQLKESHRRITHIAHGWYMRVHRSCEAVLLMRAEGYAMESWPIRRAIIEHVVALKWLAAEGNKVADIVRRRHAVDAEKRKRAVLAAEWTTADLTIFDEVIADQEATEEVRSYDNLRTFAERCKRYGSPGDMSGYLIDTAHSHPSWETASPYLHNDDGNITRLSEPRFDSSRDDAGYCAIRTWEALMAINGMMAQPPWDDALTSARDRIVQVGG